MSRPLSRVAALLLFFGACLTPVQAREVAIYTGNTNWIDKGPADAQAQICIDKLTAWGISYQWFQNDFDTPALADWMASATGNGEPDVLILFGYFPDSIYPAGNASPEGSIAELFIESTDGDAIINSGDWMFYVSSTNNGPAGLQSMMDIPGIVMSDDNTAVFATTLGKSIAPSVIDFASDRPFHVDQLAGAWVVEAALAQNAAGTRADPIIVRDGDRGRLIPLFQADHHDDPKGAVAAEVIAWLFGVEIAPTKLVLSRKTGDLVGEPVKLSVQLVEDAGNPRSTAGPTTVSLVTSAATGVFDTAANGNFNGTVTSVTVPAGQAYAEFFYKDTAAGAPVLTASAAGLAGATYTLNVVARGPAGEVAIYTGNTSWITKGLADAQAKICTDKLKALGIKSTVFANVTDDAALADWVSAATNNGKQDVLILYGFFPDSLYSGGNAMPDGSIAELFIESTDGDAIINGGDYMFYVSTTNNNDGGLSNMMDIPGIVMWDDNTPMFVTDQGRKFTPSLVNFASFRPFHVDQLANEWFVEAAFAELGPRADPIVVRDGNRGRLIPALQFPDLPGPRGAVDSEIIAWLMGIDLGGPAKLGLSGSEAVSAGRPMKVTVQVQTSVGSPSKVTAATKVSLQTSSAGGAFDTAANGSFNGSITSITVPAGASSADVYYKDTTAGTPVLTASAPVLTGATLQVKVFPQSHAPAGRVAIYTGNTNWIAKPLADVQAQIYVDRLTGAGIENTWFASDTDVDALAEWMTLATNDGKLDVLVLFGYFPSTIYPAGNAMPDGSIAELFIESTDGDAIINHADWMFYVSNPNNAEAGLQNMMDVPGISLFADNTPVAVTPEGRSIAPSLVDFLSDRPFFPDQLTGDWFVEAALAQSADGTKVDPIIVRDGTRGRLIPALQAADQNDPKGAVGSEIIAWLMGVELKPTKLVLSGAGGAVTGQPVKLTVNLQDNSGTGTPAAADVTVTLASDSSTGVFDAAKSGSFDGTTNSVTIPAGGTSATVYYRDTSVVLATLTATAPPLAEAQLQVNVLEDVSVSRGEVAIFTGNTSWIEKPQADEQAQICADKLTAAGITSTVFSSDTDTAALADWMTSATNNGKLDVLVLYGFFPDSIYPAGNLSPDGSIAELFIESTDGDVIIDHGDWMFYVSSTNNGPDGLANMMDIPGITMTDDNTPMVATDEGKTIAPSLTDFLSDRPFHVNELAGEWFAEAVLAQNAAGTRADPIIVRDGNRGRLVPIFQADHQDDPKGAVAAEVISWLMAKTTGVVAPVFRRGDADGSGTLDLTDAIFLLSFLFQGGATPTCLDAADADDSGALDLTDPIYILSFLFQGGAAIPPPGQKDCGPDTTPQKAGQTPFAPCVYNPAVTCK